MKKIALGTDHAGYEMREVLKVYSQQKGYEILDFGTYSEEVVDYPIIVDLLPKVLREVIVNTEFCGGRHQKRIEKIE